MAWGARNLISTQASARHVVEYLELVDPEASRTADDLYGFLAASEDEYAKACLEDARGDARIGVDVDDGDEWWHLER